MRLTVGAARLATSTPARVEPVNEIMSMSGCSLMAAPTSGPRPLTRLNTPFGTPASCRISAKINADDGDGFAHHHRRADRLFEVIVFQDLERGCEVAEAGAGLHLLRHRQRRTHLVGDGGANILHAGLVDLDDFREQRHALLAGGLRKRREGAPGRGHRLVDVGLGAERNLIHRLFGRRVDDGGGLLDDRIDPGAIDVELHALDHRKPLDFGANGRGTERSASILARKLGKMNPPYTGRRTAADAPYKISAVKEARRPRVICARAGKPPPRPSPASGRGGQSAFAANTEQEPQRHNWYFTAHFM